MTYLNDMDFNDIENVINNATTFREDDETVFESDAESKKMIQWRK